MVGVKRSGSFTSLSRSSLFSKRWKKRTTAEARRLQCIQEELQKLDLSLSNDVNILRDQIEAASLNFMEAQKRFDKAEKEFLDAKLQLFNCLEKKELLTQHLCTIIEQNEMRKAQKLSELMDKLELGEKSESPAKSVILAPYSNSALPEPENNEETKSFGIQNKAYTSSTQLDTTNESNNEV